MLRVIKPADFERVCQFTAGVFCSHEPMCVALAVTAADFVQQFNPILEACCTSGLSVLLESNDTDTKDIMSLSLALTFNQYSAVELPEHPSFTPVLSVFDDLAHPIEKEPGAAMSFIWATHDSHMNKGYTKRVVAGTVRAAEAAGLTWLVTDVTNVVSQHVAMKYFGYQPIAKVRYHDYEHFKCITCTEYVIRAIKPLNGAQQQQRSPGVELSLPSRSSCSSSEDSG